MNLNFRTADARHLPKKNRAKLDNVGLTDSLFGLVLSQTQFMDLKFVIFEGFGLVCSTYVDLGCLFRSWQNMRSKVWTFWRGSQKYSNFNFI